MFKIRLKSVLGGALIGAATLVGGAAQAATYAGSWDPYYGAPLTDLFWTANGTFEASAACLSVNGTHACSGSDFQITSMSLDFYHVTYAAGDPGHLTPLKGSFAEHFDLNLGVQVNSVVVANGQLVALNTLPFDSVAGLSTASGSGAYSFALYLFEDAGVSKAQLEFFTPANSSAICTPQRLTAGTCGFSANDAIGTITPTIPEPSTYALLAAGLGVVGFCARRRRRASA